jgi:hypothetical protein
MNYHETVFKEKLTPALEDLFDYHYLKKEYTPTEKLKSEIQNQGPITKLVAHEPVTKKDNFFIELLDYLYQRYVDSPKLNNNPTENDVKKEIAFYFKNKPDLEVLFNHDVGENNHFDNFAENLDNYDFEGVVEAFIRFKEFETISNVDFKSKDKPTIRKNRKNSII